MSAQMREEYDRLLGEFHEAQQQMSDNFGNPDALARFRSAVDALSSLAVRLEAETQEDQGLV